MFQIQVMELTGHGAHKLYVLECDDSQGNILRENDWATADPPVKWTQTLTSSKKGKHPQSNFKSKFHCQSKRKIISISKIHY